MVVYNRAGSYCVSKDAPVRGKGPLLSRDVKTPFAGRTKASGTDARSDGGRGWTGLHSQMFRKC